MRRKPRPFSIFSVSPDRHAMPHAIAVGGWLLVDNEKMSKSTGNVVKPLDMVDTVGVDGLRYYVLPDTPYGNDGDFTVDGLIGRYNSDLANNLGNLTSRVATVVGSKCGGVGPAPSADNPLVDAAAAAVEGAIGGLGRRSRRAALWRRRGA